MKPTLNELPKEAKDKHIENKKYFDKLKKKTPKNLDYVMQDLHNAEFKKTDCFFTKKFLLFMENVVKQT